MSEGLARIRLSASDPGFDESFPGPNVVFRRERRFGRCAVNAVSVAGTVVGLVENGFELDILEGEMLHYIQTGDVPGQDTLPVFLGKHAHRPGEEP